MKSILLILSCAIWYAKSEPNYCCQDNEPVWQFKCNSSALWIQVCHADSYILTDEEFKLNDDDTLSILPENQIIETDKFCVSKMDGENIAMICFPNTVDDDGIMSAIPRTICGSISIICLILTLFVYIVLPNLRDTQGKCMMSTIFSLLMSFIFLLVIQENSFTIKENSCQALAFVLYFWFMCTFFWLNVVAFNVWRSVVKPKWLPVKNYLFLCYNIYGWGCPTFLLVILIICHHTNGDHIKPKIAESKCWFHDSEGLRAYFYGPICGLIILNIIMFIHTAWALSKQIKTVAERKYRSHKYKMCLYLKLFIVMGICWIFEPLSEFLETQGRYLWMVTDYINCLQGLLIFLLLVAFRRRVRRDLARKGGLCCRGLPKEWATMADEDCEELEEDVDELSDNTTPVIQTPTLNI